MNAELLCGVLIFASGVFVFVATYLKKHTWVRTSAVITEIKNAGKSAAVWVDYQVDHARFSTGCIVQKVEIAAYQKKIGREIEITVSPKDPTTVHILSTKSGYVAGLFFTLASLLYIVLFHVI